MEITVYPLGTGRPCITRELEPVIDILDRSGLRYEISVMGTIVEGSLDDLLALARRLHEAVFSESVKRVVTIIRLDDRRE
jgi:uncharacterized protein (TIGR00106 family)